MSNVRVLDADLIDGCAAGVSQTHDDLWWTLHLLEFGAGAVPWQVNAQLGCLWEDIRRRMRNELGYMDADAAYLRKRAEWTRIEQLKSERPMFAGLLSALFPHEPVAPAILVDGFAPTIGVPPPTPLPAPPSSLRIADLPRADQVMEFKARYLGKTGIEAVEGKSDQFDGECVSLVKRYATELNPAIGSLQMTPKSNGPAFPGWTMIPLVAGVKVQPGDIVYFNYDFDDVKAIPPIHEHYHHVAIVSGDEDPKTGVFEMIESHGYETGKGVQLAKNAKVQLSHQGHTYLTAIMRRN